MSAIVDVPIFHTLVTTFIFLHLSSSSHNPVLSLPRRNDNTKCKMRKSLQSPVILISDPNVTSYYQNVEGIEPPHKMNQRGARRRHRSQDRLPNFSDRGALPYSNAIIKEAMRWQPVTPLGTCTLCIRAPLKTLQQLIFYITAAHMCTADDEYDGYFILKGTVVLGNSWSILSQLIDDHMPF